MRLQKFRINYLHVRGPGLKSRRLQFLKNTFFTCWNRYWNILFYIIFFVCPNLNINAFKSGWLSKWAMYFGNGVCSQHSKPEVGRMRKQTKGLKMAGSKDNDDAVWCLMPPTPMAEVFVLGFKIMEIGMEMELTRSLTLSNAYWRT